MIFSNPDFEPVSLQHFHTILHLIVISTIKLNISTESEWWTGYLIGQPPHTWHRAVQMWHKLTKLYRKDASLSLFIDQLGLTQHENNVALYIGPKRQCGSGVTRTWVRKAHGVRRPIHKINPLIGTFYYSAHRIIWSWYTGRWWVGCYIWYSEEGTGRSLIIVGTESVQLDCDLPSTFRPSVSELLTL